MTRTPPPPKAPPPRTAAKFAVPEASPVTLRQVVYAVPGWGKTTLASQMPDPVIVTAPGEEGYYTLLSLGRVPKIPAAKAESWADLLALIREFASSKHMTLVLDSLSSFEELAKQELIASRFGGDPARFYDYGKGPVAMADRGAELVAALGRVGDRHVCVVSHPDIIKQNNTMGADYFRQVLLGNTFFTSHVVRWANTILYGKFDQVVKKDRATDNVGKGIGGDTRVVFTQDRDAFLAKNCAGMPFEIEMPDDHTQMWETVAQHIPNLKEKA